MFKKRNSKKASNIKDTHLVLAAVGVMEDEYCGAVPTDDVNFCLRIDFKYRIKDTKLLSILSEAVSAQHAVKNTQGWQLSESGEKIADQVLRELA